MIRLKRNRLAWTKWCGKLTKEHDIKAKTNMGGKDGLKI